MPCHVLAGAIIGVDARLVRVEVDLVRRLPRTTVVGLPANAVRESTERVRSAIIAAGFEYPKLRVTINLAPADIRKEGTAFDLPIAVGILAASGQVPKDLLDDYVLAGELSLGGALRSVRGGLPLAMMAAAGDIGGVILPESCAGEAAVVPGVNVWAASSLAAVVAMLRGESPLPRARSDSHPGPPLDVDLADVRGQPLAVRALEIAAAGGHNLLMVGPPGVGKTMLAARLPTILPPLSFDEALDVTRIYSVAGLMPPGSGLVEHRPFRAPHHSVSAAGLLGGASLRPGEVSLAHHGVLFLDELPEFQRHVLELLRGPLEDRCVVITRAAGTVRLPASFTLVAAANPCPCGYLGHPLRPCRCVPSAIARYRARLSGPLLDRIDMHVRVEPVDAEDLCGSCRSEASARVRERVEAARRLQSARYEGSSWCCNAELGGPAAREAGRATLPARNALRDAVSAMALSGRAHDRILKVARTIADLDGAPRVDLPHVAEAIAFRGQDCCTEDLACSA